VVYDGGVGELVEAHGGERTLVVDLEVAPPTPRAPHARVVRVEGSRQWLRFRRADTTAAQLAAAVGAQANLLDLAVEEPDIEEVVARLYGRP
jgi:ABC-2 type transport system ATP-binding protein